MREASRLRARLRGQPVEQPGHALGEGRIGGHGDQLFLPQRHVAPGQLCEIGRFGHETSIGRVL
jgi:hypothetical protein